MSVAKLGCCLLVGALSVGLAGAAGAKPKAKALPACATWADPAGDAAPGGAPAGGDKTLDITKVTYAVTEKDFTAKIAVPDYSGQHTEAYGARFTAEMTVGGHVTIIYAQSSPTTDTEKNVFYQSGISVDGAQAEGTDSVVTSSVAAGVVSLSVPIKALAGAVGTKILPSTPATDVKAKSRGTYVALLSTFDTAAGDAAKFTFAPCA